MSRTVISAAGALVSLGFLSASAVANYMFGASLGRTPWEATLYGAVGVLAVVMNALAPFYISWSLAASRRTTAVGVGLLWTLCLVYSTTSALGFAAQNRDTVVTSRRVASEAYGDIRRELLDLEARRTTAKAKDRAGLNTKIDQARRRLDAWRTADSATPDAQSEFLSAIFLNVLDPRHIRLALIALFAFMIEVGATLGLFAALSHRPVQPSQQPRTRWKPTA